MNNAVARAAGLLAVAVLPLVAGLSGEAYTEPGAAANRRSARRCGSAPALLLAGGVLAAIFVRTPTVNEGAGPGDDEGCVPTGAAAPSTDRPSTGAPATGAVAVGGEAA